MVKAVFFDAGETLIHRNPSLIAITSGLIRGAGHKKALSRVAAAINKAAGAMKSIVSKGIMSDSEKWDHYMRLVFRDLGIQDPALLEIVKKRLKSGTSFRPYREVSGVLREVRSAGLKMGVISNAPAELMYVLKRTGLADKFDNIIISEDAGVEKPHRKIFEIAVKKAKVKKEEFLYVGDNYLADIKGGIKAGVKVVWLLRDSKHAQFSFKGEGGHDVPKIKKLRQLVPLMKKKGWI